MQSTDLKTAAIWGLALFVSVQVVGLVLQPFVGANVLLTILVPMVLGALISFKAAKSVMTGFLIGVVAAGFALLISLFLSGGAVNYVVLGSLVVGSVLGSFLSSRK
ncbi:hypothetical protein CMO96_04725 [Candidatus Woesebacteria bacterium]|nr:hypothetical protein [Candidatus Woesebacteria bacterium]|tara:strand:- start:1269 stop:1586 length:318 start_codon:yes stop_codon:yes gene_type:complete